MYRVTELNVTQIWIEWAGRQTFFCLAKFSLSGLCFITSPGTGLMGRQLDTLEEAQIHRAPSHIATAFGSGSSHPTERLLLPISLSYAAV